MNHRLRLPLAFLIIVFFAYPILRLDAATIYKPGDIAENFSLINRATRQPVQLSDFAGKIVVLDWFAWWCPFCQAAAPQLYSGIDEYYATEGGNPGGIPVVHVGVNLQSGQESQTQNFVNLAGFDVVLEDFSRTVASRFASSGQPIFGIINCVTNSPSHAPYEVLYVQAGYGQTSFPVSAFRAAIDSIQAPPAAVMISSAAAPEQGTFVFQIGTTLGQSGRWESSTNLTDWSSVQQFTATNEATGLTVTNGGESSGRYFRVVPQ
jgi:thiol-disulfide isomerase/thioredoxin